LLGFSVRISDAEGSTRSVWRNVCDAASLPKRGRPRRGERRIEFFGDSMTAGYCTRARADARQRVANRSSFDEEAFTLSFGWRTAELLRATVRAVAWSGIGLVRNSRGSGPSAHFDEIVRRTLGSSPRRRWQLVPSSSDAADSQAAPMFVPHVVVIGLGTNDFSNFSSNATSSAGIADARAYRLLQEKYVRAFTSLLRVLARGYGRQLAAAGDGPLLVVATCGPMLYSYCGLLWRIAREWQQRPEQLSALVAVDVLTFERPPANADTMPACGTHPTAAGHVAMAKQLVRFVERRVRW
jgi:lysophospholipase L1-like esterase